MIRADPSRAFAFMHVPKTSGVALTQGLINALRPDTWLTGFDRSVLGGFNRFETLEEPVRGMAHQNLNPCSLPAHRLFWATSPYPALWKRSAIRGS